MFRYSAAVRAVFRSQHRLWKLVPPEWFTLIRVQKTLCGFGFPTGRADGRIGPLTVAAVTRFQEAFNGGRSGLPLLVVDGKLGPLTKAALLELPYLSPHFTASEVASKGNGDAYVKRELLSALELERAELGRPLRLISCYRDPDHNAAVGGAKGSRHLYGEAVDISRNYNLRLSVIKAKRRYTGIGYLRESHRCTHLDVRPGSPTSPRMWTYPE